MLGATGLGQILEALHQICDGTAHRRRRQERPFPSHDRCRRPSEVDNPPRPNSFRRHPVSAVAESDVTASREWERRLAAYTSRAVPDPPTDDPGLRLLRTLADQARLGQLTLTRPDLLHALLKLGLEGTDQLLHDYLNASPPRRLASSRKVTDSLSGSRHRRPPQGTVRSTVGLGWAWVSSRSK